MACQALSAATSCRTLAQRAHLRTPLDCCLLGRHKQIDHQPTLYHKHTYERAHPAGLFMPSIMIGGSYGALCGLALARALPGAGIQPGVFAVVATAAALGGVFRSSISIVAILLEGTQGGWVAGWLAGCAGRLAGAGMPGGRPEELGFRVALPLSLPCVSPIHGPKRPPIPSHSFT